MSINATKAVLSELKAYGIGFDAVLQTHSDLFAEAAAKDGDPEVLGYTEAMAALRDADPQVRHMAMFKLSEIGGLTGGVVSALIRMLDDPVDYIRADAASILGYMGEVASSAIPKLHTLLRDTSLEVQDVAAAALAKLDSN